MHRSTTKEQYRLWHSRSRAELAGISAKLKGDLSMDMEIDLLDRLDDLERDLAAVRPVVVKRLSRVQRMWRALSAKSKRVEARYGC